MAVPFSFHNSLTNQNAQIMETGERLIYLFNGHVEETNSVAEQDELFAMINSGKYDDLLAQLLSQQWNGTVPEWRRENEQERADVIFNSVRQQLKLKRTFPLKRVAFAAGILLLLGVGSYLLTDKQQKTPAGIVLTPNIQAPLRNKAVITLSNGQRVSLDSINNLQQGNVKVIRNASGAIAYQEAGTGSGNTYNTLTNPRGSKVAQITLTDGSKVWLNAGSSLQYPVAFTGTTRNVTITGEAYFEITTDAARPFKVSKGDVQVNVLGTKFNVNAWDDEAEIKVTLLQGSVEVRGKNIRPVIIKPGEQALIAADITVSSHVNPEEVIAWKSGMFRFGAKTDLQHIMRQIARWYDIEVLFKGNIENQHFGGEIPGNSDLQQVLEILKTSGVNFDVQGRTVIVKP